MFGDAQLLESSSCVTDGCGEAFQVAHIGLNFLAAATLYKRPVMLPKNAIRRAPFPKGLICPSCKASLLQERGDSLFHMPAFKWRIAVYPTMSPCRSEHRRRTG